MKTILRKSMVVFTLCLVGLALSLPVAADSFFDEYGNISWADEKLHLDDFAIYLLRNPSMKGYIAYRGGQDQNAARVGKRAARARNYLIRVRKVPADRVLVVRWGEGPEMRIILQPVEKTLPSPF